MAYHTKHRVQSAAVTHALDLRRRVAWILILIVDVGFIAWGVGAAIFLDRLLGPGGKTILPAGYEGFSKASWSELVTTAPMAARYMDVLYRTYGWYNVAFGVTTTIIAVTAPFRGEGPRDAAMWAQIPSGGR
jgi:hypothetical protein